MPKPHVTQGHPDDLVPVQVKMPLWLKRRAVEVAKARGQDLSELIRELLRREVVQKR